MEHLSPATSIPCLNLSDLSSWPRWALGSVTCSFWIESTLSLQLLVLGAPTRFQTLGVLVFPPTAAPAVVSYLLCLGVGVVQDHGDVALPPQIPQDTIVLHPSRQSFLGVVLPFPETEGLKIIRVPGCWDHRHRFCSSCFPQEPKLGHCPAGRKERLSLGQGDESPRWGQPKHPGNSTSEPCPHSSSTAEPLHPKPGLEPWENRHGDGGRRLEKLLAEGACRAARCS